MANTKISEFGSATALAGTELIPVIQGADNKNTTPLDLKKYVFKSQANIWGYVTAHADLPLTTTDTDPEAGDMVGVNTTTGTWILGTQRKMGFYKRLATTGTVDQQYGTSPYASYVPNADIIGDEAYTELNYITEENTIRENINALDVAVSNKQAILTFGIANTNAVKVDSASVADDEYARFTANGLESRSASEMIEDIGVMPKATQITSITLSSASWSLVSGLYEYDYSNAAITADSIVEVIPDNEYIAVVKAAEILPKTVSSAGSVKLYATNTPTGNIGVTMNLTTKA